MWPSSYACLAACPPPGAKGDEIKAIAGKLTDAETMIAVKDLLNRLGSGNMKHEVRQGLCKEEALRPH